MGEEAIVIPIPLYLWKTVGGGGLVSLSGGWLAMNGLLLLAV